ncbi:MAG TPA: PQQ-binding-like beta-propeller repeat protein [Vicinamibacterales bacterium]|nr:PQQ-binding-like beta-propeller repeat protein [Vicinamibacterales bacterium]
MVSPLGGCPEKAKKPDSVAATAPAPLLPANDAWTIQLSSNPSAEGAADDERLYVPLKTDRLVALALETGEQVWESKDPVATAQPPVVSGPSIFVATAEAILELDASTGITRRRVSLSAPSVGPLTSAGDLLLVPQSPDLLVALRISDGSRAWTATLGAPVQYAAAIHHDRSAAYFALGEGSLAAVSLASGKILWTVQGLGALTPVVAAGDRVLVGSTDKADKMFYAFNAKNGAESWRLSAGDVVGAASADGLVFIVSKDNVVKAVNRDSGNQRWIKTMNTRPLMPPRVIGNQLLVVGVSPVLTLHDVKTGMPAGTYAFSGSLHGAILEGQPVLTSGGPDGSGPRLILITRDGRVVALRPGAEGSKTDPGAEPDDKDSEPSEPPARPDATVGR